MLCGRFDDPDIRLMRNEEVDVLAGETSCIESAVGRLRHRSDGVLEHLTTRHPYELGSLLQHLLRELVGRPATGPVQKISKLTVASHESGQDALPRLCTLHDRRAGAVSEQHTGCAVFPVNDRAHFFRANYEDRLSDA